MCLHTWAQPQLSYDLHVVSFTQLPLSMAESCLYESIYHKLYLSLISLKGGDHSQFGIPSIYHLPCLLWVPVKCWATKQKRSSSSGSFKVLHKNLIDFTFFPWVCVSSLLFPTTCHAHWAFIQTTLSTWIDFPSPEKLSGRQAWDQIPLPSTSHIQVFIPNWLLTSEKPQDYTF